jgi:hypothetical protein
LRGAGDFHQLKKNAMPVPQTLEKSAGIICQHDGFVEQMTQDRAAAQGYFAFRLSS